jgi:hypothetical protein
MRQVHATGDGAGVGNAWALVSCHLERSGVRSDGDLPCCSAFPCWMRSAWSLCPQRVRKPVAVRYRTGPADVPDRSCGGSHFAHTRAVCASCIPSCDRPIMGLPDFARTDSAFAGIRYWLVRSQSRLASGSEFCAVFAVQSFCVGLLRALDRLGRPHFRGLHRRESCRRWGSGVRSGRSAIVRGHRAAGCKQKCGCGQGRQIFGCTHRA